MNDDIEFSKKILELIEQDKIDEAKKRMFNRIPDFLYKFFSLGHGFDKSLMTNLQENKIYFNAAHKMKDKTEYKNIKKCPKDESTKEIVDNMDREQIRDHLFTCFTYDENCINNEYMWQTYANGAQGFLCKFSVIDKTKFYPVLYSNEEPFMKQATSIYGDENEKLFEKNRFLFYVINLILKKEEYSVEKEIRLFYHYDFNLCCCSNKYVSVKDKLELIEIYLGANCSFKNKGLINKSFSAINIIGK
ncbi:MAG: hypothetical protein ACI4MT_03085 [Christensenellales bacterium]